MAFKASKHAIDEVYVLNLEGDRAKWGHVASSLARHGMQPARFPATDGNSETIVNKWREYRARGFETDREAQLQRRLIVSPGAWGYLLTMKRLLLEAKERRLRRIAVFDDDVVLHKRFRHVLDVAVSELPNDWKLVYLGCTQTAWSGVEDYSPNLYKPRRPVDGSFAYMIDSSVFDHLIARIDRFDNPFDSGPLAETIRKFPDSTFVVRPNVAIPDVRYSDLRAPRDQEEFAAKARWDLREYENFPVRTGPNGVILREPVATELLSVIVIVSKAVPDVSCTLGSLRLQTDAAFEVVVVDNTGRPGLTDLIENAAHRDSRVRALALDEAVPWAIAAKLAVDVSAGGFLNFLPPGAVALDNHVAALRAGVAVGVDAVAAAVDLDSKQRIAGACPETGGAGSRYVQRGETASLLFGGLLSRGLLMEVGQIFEGSEAALREAVRRAEIGRELRGASAPNVVEGNSRPHLIVDAKRARISSSRALEWDDLHREIMEQLRPSYQHTPCLRQSAILRIGHTDGLPPRLDET